MTTPDGTARERALRLSPDALSAYDLVLRSEAHLAELLRGLSPSITFNLLGLPSVQVPTGLGDGLPTGHLVNSTKPCRLFRKYCWSKVWSMSAPMCFAVHSR